MRALALDLKENTILTKSNTGAKIMRIQIKSNKLSLLVTFQQTLRETFS